MRSKVLEGKKQIQYMLEQGKPIEIGVIVGIKVCNAVWL